MADRVYLLMIRPGIPKATPEVMDVSCLANPERAELRAADAVLKRMGETPVRSDEEWADDTRLASYLSVLYLRVRFNNMEGPYVVRSSDPIDPDAWDDIIANEELMTEIRKNGTL